MASFSYTLRCMHKKAIHMCLLSQYGKKQSFLNPSPGARDLEVSVFVIPEREGNPCEAACP